MSDNELLLSVKELARKAGLEIMEAKASALYVAKEKSEGYAGRPGEDNDIVTSSDLASDAFLKKELPNLNSAVIRSYNLPVETDIKIVSEEGAKLDGIDDVLKSRAYWVIDPLDGTKYFAENKKGFFSVNVALIIDGNPALGAVYFPDTGELLFGDSNKKIAMREQWENGSLSHQSSCLPPPQRNSKLSVAVQDKEHYLGGRTTEASQNLARRLFGDGVVIEESNSVRSVADILLGKIKAFLRIEDISAKIWDFAASDAILRALGGMVVISNGQPINYREIEVEKASIMGPGCEAQIEAMRNLAEQEIRDALAKK